jgi:hypothetical protein
VPFCEECAKYWAPASVKPDGSCPQCGRPVDQQGPSTLSGKQLRQMAGEDAKAPWHFKLLVVLAILYLAWRVVDLIR